MLKLLRPSVGLFQQQKTIQKEISLIQIKTSVFLMVPTARLELAQLSPLPPQDSVSTNFTTSAV